jgi:hypothetical protein
LLDTVGVHSLQGYRGRVPHPVAVGNPQPLQSEGA